MENSAVLWPTHRKRGCSALMEIEMALHAYKTFPPGFRSVSFITTLAPHRSKLQLKAWWPVEYLFSFSTKHHMERKKCAVLRPALFLASSTKAGIIQVNDWYPLHYSTQKQAGEHSMCGCAVFFYVLILFNQTSTRDKPCWVAALFETI